MPQIRWGTEWWKEIEALQRQVLQSDLPYAFDALAASAYAVIFLILVYLVSSRRLRWPANVAAAAIAVIALVGAAGKAIVVFNLARTLPWVEAAVKMVDEGTLVLFALVGLAATYRIARRPSPRELQRAIDRQLVSLKELRQECDLLEQQVAVRTAQLQETTHRFETVLRQSPVSVFSQDKSMRYTWIRNPPPSFPPDVINRTDDDILPREAAAQMSSVKHRVMDSGAAIRTEIVLEADGEQRWYDLTVEPVRAVDGSVVGTTSAAVDISYRKNNEELLQVLLKEVTHRTKNLLAIIQAIVRHVSPREASPEGFTSRLVARLQALSLTHDLLVAADWRGIALRDLVAAQVAARANSRCAQIRLEGEEIILRPNAADTIGLVVHELVENAVAYGALCVAEGRVKVVWRLTDEEEDARLVLRWEEIGGPPVREPTGSGFGRRLIENAYGNSLTADVKLSFDTEGVRCQMSLPAYQVIKPLPRPGQRPARHADRPP